MQTTKKTNYRDGWFDDTFEVIYECDLSDRTSDGRRTEETEIPESYPVRNVSSRAFDPDSRKKQTRKMPNVISPMKSTVHTGSKAIFRLLQIAGRILTLVLIAASSFLIFKDFWTDLPLYGSLASAVADRNYMLGAYLAVPVCLLGFEAISFLWAMTGPVSCRGNKKERIDTGRGLFCFLLTGAGSFAASVFSSLVPSSPEALNGLRGALEIYGGLSHTLLLICTAGMITCLVRRFCS